MEVAGRISALLAAGMLATLAQAAPLGAYLARAELAPAARPALSRPFSFNAQPGEDGTLEVSIDDDALGAFADAPLQRYLLRIQPKDGGHRIDVRQRTLIYMNIGDEGPHVAIPGTEQRGAWQAGRRLAERTLEVGGLAQPTLALTRTRLLAAVKATDVGRDARWLALARQCRTPDDGACYTVTDQEYEVTVSKAGRIVARGILRLRQPNGC